HVTIDPASTRSEAVHVNLLGYAPRAPQKFAYAYAWMGDRGSLDLKPYAGKPFHLIDLATKKAAFSGKLAFRKPADNPETGFAKDTPKANFIAADVFECDFSAFDAPGTYVLSIEGVGCSFPFKIDPDAYRPAYRATARGLYHNRSGIALTKPYTEFERPTPGHPDLTPGFKGKLIYTTLRWPDYGGENPRNKEALTSTAKGPLDTAWGWYQDAGDWDGYYSHLRVAQELLIAYDLASRNFRDGENNIPESGNGVPDVLDEAAWLPRFCYRLRHELIDKKYGTGGIGLRVAPDLFGSDEGTGPGGTKVGRGSWQDTRTYAVSGEDPWSTYRYAGAAAHLAFLLDRAGLKDPAGVDWSKEARESYAWATANARPGDETHKEKLRLPRAYAAAALFRLTGDKVFEEQFLADTRDVTPASLLWDESRYAPIVYALSGAPSASPDPAAQKRVTAAVLATADAGLSAADKRALRWAGNWWMPMLVGQQTTPWALELGVARKLTIKSDPARSRRYLAALYTTADYFLGTNALNMTFITGVGPRHPLHPFHMDAWYNGKPTAHEGIVPYGPWRTEKARGDGPWDAAWAHKTVYPDIDAWPGNERFFDNRCAPMTSEFTVHQTTGPSAAFYGLLAAPGIE
ncbi:MAG TPA: glycoside hydrolase family 9 protein, partial [Tepidisphaeraceae bacterium]|nr:glycoside hydrolase family 9 protein [Tepidisphaeraceae bacterium]